MFLKYLYYSYQAQNMLMLMLMLLLIVRTLYQEYGHMVKLLVWPDRLPTTMAYPLCQFNTVNHREITDLGTKFNSQNLRLRCEM